MNTVKHSSLDIDESNFVLNQFGYTELDNSKKGQIIHQSIDQIYIDLNQNSQLSSKTHHKMAILKFDISLIQSQKILKLNETDFVCHGKNSRNRFFALFLSGEKFNTFSKICNQLSENKTFSKMIRPSLNKFSLLNSIFNKSVYANNCKQVDLKSDFKNVELVTQNLDSQKLFSQLGTCLTHVFRGATASVTDVFNMFSLSPDELWTKLKDAATEMKNFVLNIRTETLKMVESFKSLNSDLVIQIICNEIGNKLIESGLAAAIGIGAVKIINHLIQVTSKIKKLNLLFNRLNHLAQLGKANLAGQVLSCAM